MATSPTQIRIDADLKKRSYRTILYTWLRYVQCCHIIFTSMSYDGLPFKVEVPKYSDRLLSAMNEAKSISHDHDIHGYNSMDDLKAALEE